MDPVTLAFELAVLIWAATVLRRHGWRTARSGLVRATSIRTSMRETGGTPGVNRAAMSPKDLRHGK